MENDNIESKILEIVKRQIEFNEIPCIFTLEKALEIAEKAKNKAKEINVPIVFCAVDTGGNLILLERMEGSLLGSINIAVNKAYTANAFKMPTHELAELSQPGNALYGIQNTCDGKVVVFGGGYPVYLKGNVVGAIGVSGGSLQEDMAVAEYSLS